MEVSAIVSALLIHPDGRGRSVDPDQLETPPDDHLLWVHFDYGHEDTPGYLRDHFGLSPTVVDALTVPETRPRLFIEDDGLLIVLRGLNLNEGADPVDLISVRCWLTPDLVITARSRKVMAIDDIRTDLTQGCGPKTSGEFLVRLIDRLSERMSVVFVGLEEAEDEVEERILWESGHRIRPLIAELRRKVIHLRRYLAPQRQVVHDLYIGPPVWVAAGLVVELREVADRITRQVEDLDAIRDRSAVAQDELESKLAENLNRNMYLMSVVAAVFLPMGLITGLLGINVRGIPGSENPAGFLVVCLTLVVIAIGEVLLFKWFRLL